MISGIVLVLISAVGLYLVYTTDYEDDVVENEIFGRLKLYIAIALLFFLGIVSILNNL